MNDDRFDSVAFFVRFDQTGGVMSVARLVVMYPKPKDVEQFKRFYSEVHVPLCRKMPGIKDIAYGYPSGPEGKESPIFCFFTATFESVEAIEAAFESSAGKEVLADIPNYSPDHHPTRLFLDESRG